MPRARKATGQHPVKGKGKLSPQQIDIDLRHYEAVILRVEGKDFRQIAEELAYDSPAAARAAVIAGIKKLGREPAQIAIDLQLQRLDEMLEVLQPAIKRGNVDAVRSAIQIEKRRSTLLGLDAPTKIASTDPSGKHAGPLIILPPVDGTLPPAVEEQLKHLSHGDENAEDEDGSSDTD